MTRQHFLSAIFLAIVIAFAPNVSLAKVKTVNLSTMGIRANTGRDMTERIDKAIRQLLKKKNPADTLVINFEPGTYQFHPSTRCRHTFFISNHDQDNPKSTALVISNANNVTLDGAGSDFIFHGRMLPMALVGCSNCSIKNISIDFQSPHIAQVEIVENDADAGIITYRPAPWVDYEIVDSTFYNLGEGWRNKPLAGIAFEPQTRHIVYRTSDIAVGVDRVYEKEPGLICAPWRNEALRPGTIIAMRTYDRPTPGVFVDNCHRMLFQNTTIHYAEGMGLIAQNSSDLTLDHFNVALRGETDRRYFTTQADATHFSGCRGYIHSVNGLYEGMMDDAINVHGTYLKVVDMIDNYTITAKYMHPQSYGFAWGEPGDTVSVVKSSTMEAIPSLFTIVDITPTDKPTTEGAKLFKIRFREQIDTVFNLSQSSYGVENISASPSVYFARNVVRNNRARGALFSTPRKVVAEGNTFDHTSGCAILLCGDCNGWFETGACRDVTITGNRFVNSLTSLFQFTNAVISIYPEIPDLDHQTQYFHSGVTITDNDFITFDTPLLYAKSVKGLIFKNNRLKPTSDYQPFHWNRSQILLQHVDDASIESVIAE